MSTSQPSASSSSFFSRAILNSLPGRVGRAAYQTVKNGAFLPAYLSPWGDSSPVEVPNVRKRDVAFFPIITPWEVGDQVLGSLSAAQRDLVYSSDVIRLSGDGSMIEAGLGHHFLARLPLELPLFLAETPEAKRIATIAKEFFPSPNAVGPSGSICTLRVRIKHRFVDEAARLRFHGEATPTSMFDPALNTSKGWFAPYLHATNRTPYISRLPFFPRTTQPNLVIFDGPALYRDGDYALATDLFETSPWVMDFCNAPPSAAKKGQMGARIAVLLVGISPPSAVGWSSARRPGECIMDFTLPNMSPTILLPAASNAPLITYDAHTLADVLDPSSSLTEQAHADYIHEYLRVVVDQKAISGQRMETYVRRAVECLVGCVRKCGDVMGKPGVASRAGIVFLKLPDGAINEMGNNI